MQVVFPGSFDPPSYGHINIIERCTNLFSKVIVLVAVNPNKKYLLTPEERKTLLSEYFVDNPKVSVCIWQKLIVEYLRAHEIAFIVRGVRTASDFPHEFDLAQINRSLFEKAETLFMPTDKKYFLLRSSTIKDLLQFNANVDAMLPPNVKNLLNKRIKKVSDEQ